MLWWFQVNSKGTQPYIHACIWSLRDSPPIQAATQHWALWPIVKTSVFIWLCWVLVVALRIFVALCRSFSGGLWHSSCNAWALDHVVPVVAAYQFSCSVACGILVPQPGIEPMSPALQGRFLTTGPPGKSLALLLSDHKSFWFWVESRKRDDSAKSPGCCRSYPVSRDPEKL